MRRPSPSPWIPSTEQLFDAPERASLAALDATLLLAARALLAAHLELRHDGRYQPDPQQDPFAAPLLPVAAEIIRGATHLRRLVGEYRHVADQLLADAPQDCDDP